MPFRRLARGRERRDGENDSNARLHVVGLFTKAHMYLIFSVHYMPAVWQLQKAEQWPGLQLAPLVVQWEVMLQKELASDHCLLLGNRQPLGNGKNRRMLIAWNTKRELGHCRCLSCSVK